MPRFALKFNPAMLDMVTQLTGEDAEEVFGNGVYVILEPLSPTEFNMKIVNEEQMLEAFKTDSELQIIQL